MKVKSFKKLFVSITLSAALTFSTAATTFAATAQLSPIEQPAELTQEATSDVPDIDFSHRTPVPLLPRSPESVRLQLL